MIEQRWQLWLIGWAVAAASLGILYLRQRRTRDATAVDAGWALSLVLCATLYALLAPGALAHRVLIATVAGLENLRIAWLVAGRTGEGEDSRYRELRERWRARGREQASFAVFYQAQALLAAALSWPFLLACFNRHSRLSAVEWAGAALWLTAAGLEAVSDRQLAAFRSDPANEGKTLRRGLWRYSRHPNYFFQSLTWLAYALIAVAAPWGWLAFFAAAAIVLLVRFVTGVPPAEASSLRSRGDDYRRYQQQTSAFVPWFPKSSTG
jgi:steroid 5-alpha reductase family enzyme